MSDGVREKIEAAIIARLRKGDATFMQIHCSIDMEFRDLDSALQRLRRRGVIRTLPRVSGKRPQSLWTVAEETR